MSNEYVDLGLPSGTLWAKCNIGAATETDCGDYFMWGSTTPDTNNICDWANAPFNGGQDNYDDSYFNAYKSGWLDENGVLKSEYDAAHVIMGDNWKIPTKADFNELLANTTNEWVENYQDSGVNGRLFTSNTNGNTMFIPAAGFHYGSSFYDQNAYGYVWSSLLNEDCLDETWAFGFNSDGCLMGYNRRRYGFSVRAVMNLGKD